MLKTSSRHVTNKCLLGWFLVYWSFKRQPHKVVKHTQKIRWLLTFCFVYLYLVCCDKPFFELSLSKTSFGWIWPTIVIKNCLCFRCLWKTSSTEMLFQITLGLAVIHKLFCASSIRPQFVVTLFIVRLRHNMLMRRAVIINY